METEQGWGQQRRGWSRDKDGAGMGTEQGHGWSRVGLGTQQGRGWSRDGHGAGTGTGTELGQSSSRRRTWEDSRPADGDDTERDTASCRPGSVGQGPSRVPSPRAPPGPLT